MPKVFINKKYALLTIILVGCLGHLALSQPKGMIQSKYFSVDDYMAGTQNWAVIQDKRGVMYFGNTMGLLEFDGENWTLYKLDNGSTVRSLSVGQNSEIFVGGYGEIGILAPTQSGAMKYQSITEKIDSTFIDFKEIWDINTFGDTTFFLSDKYIFKYSNGVFSYIASKNESFYLSFAISNSYYVYEVGVGLMRYKGGAFQLVKGGDFFKNLPIHSVFSYKNGFLVGTRKNGFYVLDTLSHGSYVKSIDKISQKGKLLNSYFVEHSYYHGIEISNGIFALSSITGDILIADSSFNVKDIVDYRSIGIKSNTLYLYSNDNHNLWLALNNGICHMEAMSPYRYWNETTGINGILSDVAQVGNYMYVSTAAGVFYTIIEPNRIAVNSFFPVKGDFEQAWGFLYFQPPSAEKLIKTSTDDFNFIPDNQTLLLVATRTGVHQIVGHTSQKISHYDASKSLQQSKVDPSRIFIGLDNGIAELKYENGRWYDKGVRFLKGESVDQIGEDSLGNIWAEVQLKGLFRISNLFSGDSEPLVEHFDSTRGLPKTRYFQIYDIYNPVIFQTDSNFFYYNDSLKRIVEYSSPSRILTEEEKYQRKIDSLTRYRNYFAELTDYFVVHHQDSLVWFSDKNALFSRGNSPIRNFHRVPAALIRKVSSGDSLLYNGTNYFTLVNNSGTLCILDTSSVVNHNTVLGYGNNSLTFTYAWPYFEGDAQKTYSYYLEGYEKQWSSWTNEVKKEYTNLREGNYVFRVKAKNIYGIESPIAEYHFSILPPWYRTVYAYIAYVIGAILLIFSIVKFYTYRLIIEKNKLEQLVKERTQEILIQNEEILVQAEHLKEANDWISAKNVELEAQKEEIEKKKNELEISDATKNKFFRIIAHDLRNPISTLVNTTGYILTDIDDFDKQKTRRIIEELNKLSHTTYYLLENLLDWSTSQMGDIKFKPELLNLLSLIKENVELVKSKIDFKKITLEVLVSTDINVFADENMLHTVIRNIITNSVKFTNEGGRIVISSKVDGDFCYLSIADNGVGISEERVKKLFRIDKDVVTPGTHNERGSGLGLILSKEFIERNGGTISVVSKPEQGSTFTISLKLA